MSKPAGLLLLTGGQGSRLGGPKHLRPHPLGGSWGGHLVSVFTRVFPTGPIQLLGQPLPDRPELTPIPDPGQGPAVALCHWASTLQGPPADRWWVVACDQVRWTAPSLAAWHARAIQADPKGAAWVLARQDDHTQYLGGWLGGALPASLAALRGPNLRGLAEQLPTTLLPAEGPEWLDVDTPDALREWLRG